MGESQTVDGSGTIRSFFTGPSTKPSLVIGVSGAVLTIGENLTIRGRSIYIGHDTSVVGELPGYVVNNGTILGDDVNGYIDIGGKSTGSTPGFTNSATGRILLTGSNQNVRILAGTWINEGTIEATAGTLSLGPNNGGTWTNPGTITSTNATTNVGGTFTLAELDNFTRDGGTLNLTGTLNNTATTLTLDGDVGGLGTLSLRGGRIVGGNVITQNGAILEGTADGGTLDGATLSVGSTLRLPAATGLTTYVSVANGLTVDGTVELQGTGAYQSSLRFAGSQTVGGSGTIRSFYTGTGNVTPRLVTNTFVRDPDDWREPYHPRPVHLYRTQSRYHWADRVRRQQWPHLGRRQWTHHDWQECQFQFLHEYSNRSNPVDRGFTGSANRCQYLDQRWND